MAVKINNTELYKSMGAFYREVNVFSSLLANTDNTAMINDNELDTAHTSINIIKENEKEFRKLVQRVTSTNNNYYAKQFFTYFDLFSTNLNNIDTIFENKDTNEKMIQTVNNMIQLLSQVKDEFNVFTV